MRLRPRSPTQQDLPLKIVGSTVFGRYPKISVENTFNMIISDGWLVPYAGYANVLSQSASSPMPHPINPNGVGRAIYHSTKLNKLVVVVYNGVYLISPNLIVSQVGTIATFKGDVFIAEDIQGNIAICDKQNIYFYNPGLTPTFQTATVDGTNPIDFIPGYIAYQNTRFISVDISKSQWRLSDPAAFNNHSFPNTTQFVGGFQTKPDNPLAAIPFPGRGNLLLILGSIVGEFWQDLGLTLFPYQKSQSVNIDYGLANADTVANLDNIVCWLGINEKSGPAILTSNGGIPQQISNDGINFRLSQLTNPQDSHGFMFKQDGHIIYQLTFPTDNFSIAYDFETERFFEVTDEYMNYHIAKRVAYFNNTYYFVSLNDGNLYEFDTSITNYNYGYNSIGKLVINEIPRMRICPTIRLPNTQQFVVNNLSFPIEQGVNYTFPAIPTGTPLQLITESGLNIITEDGNSLITEDSTGAIQMTSWPPIDRVDISVSYNGGYDFTGFDGMQLNTVGNFKNKFVYYGLGWCNEFTPQFRFWSYGRIVCGDGTLSIYN